MIAKKKQTNKQNNKYRNKTAIPLIYLYKLIVNKHNCDMYFIGTLPKISFMLFLQQIIYNSKVCYIFH